MPSHASIRTLIEVNCVTERRVEVECMLLVILEWTTPRGTDWEDLRVLGRPLGAVSFLASSPWRPSGRGRRSRRLPAWGATLTHCSCARIRRGVVVPYVDILFHFRLDVPDQCFIAKRLCCQNSRESLICATGSLESGAIATPLHASQPRVEDVSRAI